MVVKYAQAENKNIDVMAQCKRAENKVGGKGGGGWMGRWVGWWVGGWGLDG